MSFSVCQYPLEVSCGFHIHWDRLGEPWTLFLVFALNILILSCSVAVLTVNLMACTILLNMNGQILSLQKYFTIIRIGNLVKYTTVIGLKVIDDAAIQSTLPLTSFLLVNIYTRLLTAWSTCLLDTVVNCSFHSNILDSCGNW